VGHQTRRGTVRSIRTVRQFRIRPTRRCPIQPLTKREAIQLMRSWMTAMPARPPVLRLPRAAEHGPVDQGHQPLEPAPPRIQPWHGPVRGFNYAARSSRDRQVLRLAATMAARTERHPDLRSPRHEKLKDWPRSPRATAAVMPENLRRLCRAAPLVRRRASRGLPRPGADGFHADTTQLVQIAQAGTTTSASTARPGTVS